MLPVSHAFWGITSLRALRRVQRQVLSELMMLKHANGPSGIVLEKLGRGALGSGSHGDDRPARSRRPGLNIGLLFTLPLGTTSYLLYQVVGSFFVNGLINLGFAWQKHGSNAIAKFGLHDSVIVDTCLTAVLLSGLTVISGSWFVRRDLEQGVVSPVADSKGVLEWLSRRSTWVRAVLFAFGFTLLGVPLAAAAIAALGSEWISFPEFLAFKLAFAMLLGAAVTPLNALLVLIDAARAPANTSAINPSSKSRGA